MSLISIAPDVCDEPSGISVGSASTVISRVTCSSTPPALIPGAFLDSLQLDRDLGLDRLVELDLLQVDVLEAAPNRVKLFSLTTTGSSDPSISRSKRAAPGDQVRASRSTT